MCLGFIDFLWHVNLYSGDETTNRLTVYFRILSRINALILRRMNDHAETSHATDITWPFQTLPDIIQSFPIEIAYSWLIFRYYRAGLSCHRPIIAKHRACKVSSKIYQLNLSLLSLPARWRLKTAMMHQHSHLGIVSASYRYWLFGVTVRSRDRGAYLNW
jgi:hypothetical protein